MSGQARPRLTRDRLAAARESLQQTARRTPIGVVPGTLPAPQQLAGLTPAETLDVLRRFGLEPNFDAFEDAMRSTVSRIGRGAGTIDAALEESLRRDIRRSFDRAAQQAAKRLVDDYRVAAQLDAGASVEWPWVWVAVQDDATCDSCDARHGREESLLDWDAEGRPGSAALSCRANCRCELVPINPG